MHSIFTFDNTLGKTLAFTRVDFTNLAGDLVAYGRKYILYLRFRIRATLLTAVHKTTRNSSENRMLTL